MLPALLLVLGAAQPGDAAPQAAPALFLRATDVLTLQRFGESTAEPRDPFPGFRRYAFGGAQLPDKSILAFEEHRLFTMIVADLSPAPAKGKEVRKRKDSSPQIVRRVILLKPATLVIDDEFRRSTPGKRVVWSLQSTGSPKVEGRRVRIVEGEREILLEPLLPRSGRIEKSLRAPGRPQAGHVIDVLCEDENPQARFLHVLHVREAGESQSEAKVEMVARGGPPDFNVRTGEGVFRLRLPSWTAGAGHVVVATSDGKPLLERRPLASGILPHTPEGVATIERWDRAYRGGARPGWDVGRPSSELVEAVDKGVLKPCRALELGCGAGTNAVFLAGRGFDVTAIDIAPTALAIAEQRAQKEGVQVRWLLADVLSPPRLEPFELIYDRGCYHGVRRQNAAGYVAALERLSKPGTRVLILAGNANEPPPHSGPPRVKEEEIRADFSKAFAIDALRETRFDTSDPNRKGALAWVILLRRKE